MSSNSLIYRVPIAWLAPVAIAIMGFAGLLGLVMSFIQGGPWLFLILWLLGVGWLGFNLIVRTPYEVVVEGGRLTWRGYRRTRTVLLSDVTRMSSAYSGSIQVIECRDGTKLRVAVMQGYDSFIRSVAATYPGVPISQSRYSTFVDKVQLQPTDKSTGDTPKGL